MIRDAIRAELAARGWSVYRLTLELPPDAPVRSVYRFLAGGRSANVATVEPILLTLGLAVRAIEE